MGTRRDSFAGELDMQQREDADRKPRGWATIGTVALIVVVPIAVLVAGYFLLSIVGLGSPRALSLSGLLSVGVAGAWGAIVALAGLDRRTWGSGNGEQPRRG